ncbi:C-X-C chemokine receptor type 4-like protein [Lates japonicus]|uniref:C-X-C chemokine receptor type 4-like protein n=1 Tax=Lates japonicus TaxID=270547 RepID=A0AAD3QZ44_LATJO|nr:C-X-C chemokine receptor type 4-like protein [Lates japonicus]
MQPLNPVYASISQLLISLFVLALPFCRRGRGLADWRRATCVRPGPGGSGDPAWSLLVCSNVAVTRLTGALGAEARSDGNQEPTIRWCSASHCWLPYRRASLGALLRLEVLPAAGLEAVLGVWLAVATGPWRLHTA